MLTSHRPIQTGTTGFIPQAQPELSLPQNVEVRNISGKGLGVVARTTILPGETIETCPMLVLPESLVFEQSRGPANGTFRFDDLEDYLFSWGEGKCAIALGWGGLYNHAGIPNARNIKHYEAARMTIQAQRQILPGQEITIHYQQVWFEPLD